MQALRLAELSFAGVTDVFNCGGANFKVPGQEMDPILLHSDQALDFKPKELKIVLCPFPFGVII